MADKQTKDDGLDLDGLMDEIDGDVERIKTHIQGFDENIGGGIPKGSIVLVAGTAGTMKSSLTFNVLYHNAKNKGLKGLYVSLEQNRSSLVRHMKNLGLDIAKVEDKINIWDLGMIRSGLIAGETWMNIFKKDLQEYKEKVGLDLLVVDSLPVLDLITNWKDPRTELFHLFEWLRDLDVTVFLISEIPEGDKKYGQHDEDFLADGIIYLRMVETDQNNVTRMMRCVKMRNTGHSMNFFTLLFEGKRFQVTKVIGQDV
jgi:circadian clock protein KaiC